MRFKAILIFLLSTTGCGLLSAQVVAKEKFRIPIRSDVEGYQMMANESGTFLHRSALDQGKTLIDFIFLDQNLSERQRGIVDIGKDMVVLISNMKNGKASFLTKTRSKSQDLNLLSIRSDTSTYIIRTFRNGLPIRPYFLEQGETYAIIAGYLQTRPVALYLDYNTGSARVLPGFFNLEGEVNEVRINPNGSFDILLALKKGSSEKAIYLQQYQSDGSLIRTQILKSGSKYNLIFARSMRLSSDSILFAGIYGNRTEFSRGIFTSTLTTSGSSVLRLYNYGDFKNFFSHLSEKRIRRIESRIQKLKQSGKSIKLPFRTLIHELVPSGDGARMLAEMVAPVYRNGYIGYTRYANTGIFQFIKPYYSQQRDFTFDGYRFTHAAVAGIKRDGTLLWDLNMNLKSFRSFTLKAFTISHETNSEQVLVVTSGGDRIKAKLTDKNKQQGDEIFPFENETSQSPKKEDRYFLQLIGRAGLPPLCAGILEEQQGGSEKTTGKFFFIAKLVPGNPAAANP
ncbi:MAG: hypothetical protein FJZ78_01745 [Bacteroidetes bacterium]|nr:hypothetical protein [Bacteroidota bacterium]